jgi:plasmid stabilization system protein ParE
MARRQLEFHEDAYNEFEAAFDWYLARSGLVAARFAREVERAIDAIAEAPERSPRHPNGTRKYPLQIPIRHYL